MMTLSNRNIFRVTGPLCGEFTGDRWIPHTKASDAELRCFLWSAPQFEIHCDVRTCRSTRTSWEKRGCWWTSSDGSDRRTRWFERRTRKWSRQNWRNRSRWYTRISGSAGPNRSSRSKWSAGGTSPPRLSWSERWAWVCGSTWTKGTCHVRFHQDFFMVWRRSYCPACGTSDLGLTASAPLLLWWEFSFYLWFKSS